MTEINTTPEQNLDTELTSDYRVLDHEEFDRRIAVSFNYAVANGTPFTLFKTDVDQLKHLNDTEGYTPGDRVITHSLKLAGVQAAILRTSEKRERTSTEIDLVSEPFPRNENISDAEAGRTGGDEIDAFAPVTKAQAQLVISRWQNGVKAYLAQPENKVLREKGVSISIGSATYEEGMSLEDLEREASRAMHISKLNQLRNLNLFQRTCFNIGRLCLKGYGVKPRYIHQYEEKHALKKAA